MCASKSIWARLRPEDLAGRTRRRSGVRGSRIYGDERRAAPAGRAPRGSVQVFEARIAVAAAGQ